MGRPRKPTALKIIAGNPGKRPLPAERAVEVRPAAKPAWLDALASPVWDELAPARIAMGLLTSNTSEAFGMLCVYIAEFRRTPLLLKGPQLTDMRAKMNAFGFDPSALAKLGIANGKPEKPANPFAELIG